MHDRNPGASARIVALDLVALAALAASVALATTVVLVATVLLLAGRADAAETRPGAQRYVVFAFEL